MLNEIFGWFGDFYTHAPDQVKGVILGSGFTLLSTGLTALLTASVTLLALWATNRANDKRLAAQLKHDRDVRDYDREMNLRREVYSSAIETMATLVHSPLRTFEDFYVTPNAIGVMREKVESLAKINLIGGAALIKEVNAFRKSVNKLYDAVGIFAAATGGIKTEVAYREKAVSKLQDSMEAAVDAVRHEMLSLTLPEDRFERLRSAHELHTKAVEEHRKEWMDSQALLDKSKSIMEEAIIKQALQANELAVAVLVEMRKELKISTESSMVAESLETSIGQTEEQAKAIMREVSRALKAQKADPGE